MPEAYAKVWGKNRTKETYLLPPTEDAQSSLQLRIIVWNAGGGT